MSRRFPRRLLPLAASVAILLVAVSANLHSRFEHQHESAANQLALLGGGDISIDGRPAYYPQFQNRVLFPILMRAAMTTGLTALPAFMVVRLATAFAACLTFFVVAWRLAADETRTVSSGLLLALGIVLSFNQGWETPSDFLDVIVFAVGAWLAIGRDFKRLALLAVLASANRESSVFLGLLWIGAGTPRARRTWVEGFGLSGLAAVVVMTLRYVVGGPRALAGPDGALPFTLGLLSDFLRHPTPTAWPMLWLALLGLVATGVWLGRPLSRVSQQLVAVSLAITAISIVCARMDELRVFLPAMTVALLAPLAGVPRSPVFPPVTVRETP